MLLLTKDSAILTEAEKTFLNTESTVENIVVEEKKINEVCKDLLGNRVEINQRHLLFFNQMKCLLLILLNLRRLLFIIIELELQL